MRTALALVLMACSALAPAAHTEELIPGHALEALGTADSDHFYSARLRAGILLRHESAYDFAGLGIGAASYQQREWSAERYSLVGALRRTERATGAGVVASAGISEAADRWRIIADATWNARLSPSAGFELIGQRDLVETRAGIDAGTMTNFVAASIDYAASERLTLIGLGGLQVYSDNNWRPHLRGRAIYTLMPEQGLGLQARARGYDSNGTAPATYFNPERYVQADVGLRLRRALGDWRMLAAAGFGEEDVEGVERKGTYYLEARAERGFGNNLWLALSYVLDHSSGSDAASADYTWHYFRAVLVIPF